MMLDGKIYVLAFCQSKGSIKVEGGLTCVVYVLFPENATHFISSNIFLRDICEHMSSNIVEIRGNYLLEIIYIITNIVFS